MKSAQINIPNQLIYEMVDGKPVYYRGYQEHLRGQKKLEQIMGSSKIQAYLVTELLFLLRSFLGREYLIFSNEIGIQFNQKNWRAADIALLHKSKEERLDNHYIQQAPDYVIEIDTKADFETLDNPLGYYQEKTQALLDFGTRRVVWIFTDTQKVLVAQQYQLKWELLDWKQDIELVPGMSVNIGKLLQDYSQ